MNEKMKGVRPYFGIMKDLDAIDERRLRGLRNRIFILCWLVGPIVALALFALLVWKGAIR